MKPVICLMNAKTPHIPAECTGYYWLQPVESLNEVESPTRDHAYILPDDSVWIINHDGNGYVPISDSGGEGSPTVIVNTDGYISVAGAGTYNVAVNLNSEKLIALIGSEVGGSLEGIKSSISSLTSNLAGKVGQSSFDSLAKTVSTISDEMNEGFTSLNDSLVNNFGGTNLLKGSKDFSGIAYKNYVTSDTYRDFTVMHFDNTSGSTTTFFDAANWTDAAIVEPDTWYTLSFWAKGTGGFNSYLYSPDEATIISGLSSIGVETSSRHGQITTTVTSGWKRYWISWKTTPTVNEAYPRSVISCRVYGGNDIYLCGVMFERGRFVHDWHYSPKDIESIITRLSSAEAAITTMGGTI